MSLNPLTNLPKDRDPKPLDFRNVNTRLVDAPEFQAPRGLDFGVTPYTPSEEIRAIRQTTPEVWGKAGMQTMGTMVGGVLEGIGFMADLPKYLYNAVTNSEQEWEKNVVAELGTAIREGITDEFEIYQTQRAMSGGIGRFADKTYWTSHMPSIASTLSIMVPGFAVSKALTYAGKLAQLAPKANAIVTTLGASVASRHTENLMEGYEVHNQMLEKYKGLGYTEQEAKDIAATAASDKYKMGYWNMLTDVVGWGALLRGRNFTSRNKAAGYAAIADQTADPRTRELARNILSFNNVRKGVEKTGFSWKDWLLQSGIEGFEEFNQEFQSNLAMRNADISAGIAGGDKKEFWNAFFSRDMIDHMKDPTAWDAALFGFIGGATFQGVFGAIESRGNKEYAAEQAKRVEREINRTRYLFEQFKQLERAHLEGDVHKAQRIRENIVLTSAIKGLQKDDGGFYGAASDGTLNNMIEYHQAILNMNEQQLKDNGFGESAKEDAQWVLNEVKKIEEIYDRNSQNVKTDFGAQFDSILAVMMSEQEYINKNSEGRLSEVNQRIEQILNATHVAEALAELNPTEVDIFRKKLRRDVSKHYLNLLEKGFLEQIGNDPYRLKILQTIRDNTKNRLKAEIEQLTEEITISNKEVKDLQKTHEKASLANINNIYNSIIKPDTPLSRAYYDLLTEEMVVDEGKQMLAMYADPARQKEIKDVIDKSDAERQGIIDQAIARRRFKDDEYVIDGEDIFRVNYTEEGAVFTPVDRQLNTLAKDPISKTFAELADAKKFAPEVIYSAEEIAEKMKELRTKLDSGDFSSALQMVNNEIAKSNYSDKQTKEANEWTTKAIADHIEKETDPNKLVDFLIEIADQMTSMERIRNLQGLVVTRLEAIEALHNKYLAVIEKKISKKEGEFNKLIKKEKEILDKLNKLENELDTYETTLLSDLQESGVNKIDKRSKAYREYKRLLETTENTRKELAEERESLDGKVAEIAKDIETLQKIRDQYSPRDSATIPKVYVEGELNKILTRRQVLRTQIMAEANVSIEQLQAMRDRFNHALNVMDQVDYAILAIEDYLKSVIDASDVIQLGVDAAHKRLMDDKLIWDGPIGTEVMSQAAFARFKRYLREELNKARVQFGKDGKKSHIKRALYKELQFINNTTMGSWAMVNHDLSIGYIRSVRNTMKEKLARNIDAIDELLDPNIQRDIDLYNDLLKGFIGAERYQRLAIEPTEKRKKVGKKKTYTGAMVFTEPQRTIFNMFNRLAGNSGTNSEPNIEPSQQRYFKFVERNNMHELAEQGYQLKIVDRSFSEGFPPITDGRDYKEGDVLYGILVDANGNYVLSDGSTTDTFDPSKSIYSTLTLPTTDTQNEFGRTFNIDEKDQSGWLHKRYPHLKPNQRYKQYLEDLDMVIQDYKEFLEEAKAQIATNGFIEKAIVGKSMGKPYLVADAYNREKAAPNSLKDFEFSSDTYEYTVSTTNFVTLPFGEIVNIESGRVLIYNKETGNYFESAPRRLTETEISGLMQLLDDFAYKSTYDPKTGKFNKDKVTRVEALQLAAKKGQVLTKKNKEGIEKWVDIRDAFRALTNAFYQNKTNIEIIWDKAFKKPQVRVDDTTYDLYSLDGDKVILNPALAKGLRDYLDTAFVNVQANLINTTEPYQHIVYNQTEKGKRGEFSVVDYANYNEYLFENEVVNTWLEIPIGDQYQFYNQQIIFDNKTTQQKQRDAEAEKEAARNQSRKEYKKKGQEAGSKFEKFEGPLERPKKEDNKTQFTSFDGPLERPTGKTKTSEGPRREEIPHPADTITSTTTTTKSGKKVRVVKDNTVNLEGIPPDAGETPPPIGFDFQLQSMKGDPVETSRALMESVVINLAQRTGIPYQILSPTESRQMISDLHREGKLKDGESTYGVWTGEQVYILTHDGFNVETPFHEFSHPIINEIVNEKPEVYLELKAQINNTEFGRQIKQQVYENYENLRDGNDLSQRGYVEAIVTAVGKLAADTKLQQANGTLWQKIKILLKQIQIWFKEQFGNTFDTLNYNTTLQEISDYIALSSQPMTGASGIDVEFQRSVIRSKYLLPGTSSQFTVDALAATDTMFFGHLFSTFKDRISEIYGREQTDLYNEIMDEVKKSLERLHTRNKFAFEKGINNQKIDENTFKQRRQNIQYVLDNFDAVKNLHRLHLSKYHLEPITEELINEDSVEKDSNELWKKEALKFSNKQTTSSHFRLLMASLFAERNDNNAFGLPRTIDFGRVFNMLTNRLANTSTLAEKRAAINGLINNPAVDGLTGPQGLISKLLLDKIDDPANLTKQDVHILSQFNQTFTRHFYQFSQFFLGENGAFKEFDANVNASRGRAMQYWKSNIDISDPQYKIEGGHVVYDAEYFKHYYPDENIYTGNTVVLNDDQIDFVHVTAQPHQKQAYINYFKAVNALADLGIVITTTVLPENMADFTARVNYIIQGIKKGNTQFVFDKRLSDEGWNLDAVVTHEVENTLDFIENSHQNQSGDNVYNANLNNFLTLIEDSFNKAASIEALIKENPHFNSTYSENSLLLNRKRKKGVRFEYFFDQVGNRTDNLLQTKFMEGFINEDTREGVPFDKLVQTDKIQVYINSLISNRFPIFRPGDNSLERFVTIQEFFDVAAIDKNEHASVFMNYIQDEVKFLHEELLSKIAPEEGNTFYTKLNKREDILNLSIFGHILQNKNLRKEFEKAVISGDISSLGKMSSAIINDINAYISKQIETTKKVLLDHYIIEKQRNGEGYINNGLIGLTKDKIATLNETQLTNIIKKATVNKIIFNIEQTKLLTGHPLYYADADNFFKRMSGMVGTKKVSMYGHLENMMLNHHYKKDRLYAFVDERGSVQKTTNYREDYQPVLRVSTLADMDVVSSSLADIEKIIGKDKAQVYANMNEGDAIGFVSFEEYREMHLRSDSWTEAMDRLYTWHQARAANPGLESVKWTNWKGENELITVDKLVNPSGKKTVFNMVKPQYFGPAAETGFVPTMFKLALLPILPTYNTPSINKMRKYMKDTNTGIVTTLSGNKVGAKVNADGVLPNLYDADGNVNTDTWVQQDTYYKYWGIQLETGNEVKTKVVKGTQVMKLLMSNLFDNGFPITGQINKRSVADTIREYENVNQELIERGIEDLKEELSLVQDSDGNYSVESIKNLTDFLIREANKRDANSNVLDSLDYLSEYVETTGNQPSLDFLSNRDKVENILAAIADTRVISQKMPGGAKVQAPVTMFEGYTKTDETTGKRVYGDKGKLLSQELKFYGKEGVMEVYLPHYFRELVDVDITQLETNLLEGLAFRIPTSGLNSIERIRIKNFLPPEAGETIIVPAEIVAKAGSDFDVDKLQIFLPNYKIKDNKPEYVKYIRESHFKTKERFLQEVYYERYGNTLEAYKKLEEKAKGKLYNLTTFSALEAKTLKQLAVALKIKGELGDAEIAQEIVSMGYKALQENYKSIPKLQEFINKNLDSSEFSVNSREALENRLIEISKDIVSAEINREQLLTPITTKTLKDIRNEIVDITDPERTAPNFADIIGNFEYMVNVIERNVQSKQGTGVAALHLADHTHAMKHGYEFKERITALPHNLTLDNRSSLGRRLDASEAAYISDILNQMVNVYVDGAKDPITFDLNASLDTANVVLTLLRVGVRPREVFMYMTQPAIKEYTHRKRVQKSILSKTQEKYIMTDQSIGQELARLYPKLKAGTEIRITPDVLRAQLKNPTKEVQRYLLDDFQQLEEHAQTLSDYMQATRIDTQAMGRNTSELDLILYTAQKIINDPQIINSEKVLTEGFLSPHYKALQAFEKMYTPFFMNKKDGNLSTVYKALMDYLNSRRLSNEAKIRILDRFKADFVTYKLMTGLPIINGERVRAPLNTEIERLFFGPNNIAVQTEAMQAAHPKNLLLKQLFPVKGVEEIMDGKRMNNVKMFDQKMSPIEQGQLIDSWRELFAYEQRYATDLVKAVILQSGIQNSPMNFSKFIPAEIYMEMTLSVEGDRGNNYLKFLQEFFLNNYHDNDLVPVIYGGQKPPKDTFIHKRFDLKTGVGVKEATNLRKRGIHPYNSVPTIFINELRNTMGDPATTIPITVFHNTRIISHKELKAIKDFRNSHSLQSYGLSTLEYVTEKAESSELSTEDQANIKRVKEASTQENAIRSIICKLIP